MDREEAESKFWDADGRYRAGDYAGALEILDELNSTFPGNKRLLYARARTLAKLRRHDEALEICDHLVTEFDHARAAQLRYRLLAQAAKSKVKQSVAATTPQIAEDDEDAAETPKKSRFRIKPVRLLLLAGIVYAMYQGQISYWLGGGLIVGYFALVYGIKFAANAALMKLFSIPFRMKGQALSGAAALVHGVTSAPAPPIEPHDDEEEEPRRMDLLYYYIDVTITPLQRTSGFRHWEPGELALAPAAVKIKSLNDLDKCYQISDVKFVENGQIKDDEGYKIMGPMRLKLQVGVPAGESEFKFVYYTESFGSVSIAA